MPIRIIIKESSKGEREKLMIKVSIIMPSLNVADFIEECIHSVTNQTLRDIEIISVDAGSVDGTAEILERYAKEDSRIKLLTSGVKSYGKQVNMGLEAARGEYVAILETDDYVDQYMYEKLYHIAENNSLDFVFADFDRFYVNSEGKKEFRTVVTWQEQPEIYRKLLTSADFKDLLNPNPNLWRGIYKKQFLLDNYIRLNETPGAAYQDICFMHRVTMKAGRAMFVPESYYRYRTDREGSSVNSVKGLQYACQEYKLLFESNEIKAGFQKRVYYMMVYAFLGEITQIFPRMDEHWVENNTVYYEWFKQQVSIGIDKGIITEDLIGIWTMKQLRILLGSIQEFFIHIKYPGNTLQLEKRLKGKSTIIFGAGIRGQLVLEKLGKEISFEAFCDNNAKLWNTELKGKNVFSLEQCIRMKPDAYYLVTVKNGSEEIKRQLQDNGIDAERICVYIGDADEIGKS